MHVEPATSQLYAPFAVLFVLFAFLLSDTFAWGLPWEWLLAQVDDLAFLVVACGVKDTRIEFQPDDSEDNDGEQHEQANL